MARRLCSADRAHQLATSAGAVEDDPVELVLRDPSQLSHMLHRRSDVGKLGRISSQG